MGIPASIGRKIISDRLISDRPNSKLSKKMKTPKMTFKVKFLKHRTQMSLAALEAINGQSVKILSVTMTRP